MLIKVLAFYVQKFVAYENNYVKTKGYIYG